MLRRAYHQWRGPHIPLTIPKSAHTVEFLAAWSADHKNSISSFALLSIHAHLDKVADAKEKNPMEDLAGLNGKISI